MFNQFDHLPDGFLHARTDELHELLGRPTLIHLEGEKKQPLFVSTLLHGNETTGFYAIQNILKRYQEARLPRSMSIFIGNVEAAAEHVRRLDAQPDFNRIWPGTRHTQCTETDIMNTVTNIMRKRKPFASIDIHNNTGRNPHYACVNVLSSHSLQLATLFTDTTVYFTNPKGVQSSAFSDFCPAIVLECGQSSDVDSVEHATHFLESALKLDSIPGDNPNKHYLYHTVARATIADQYSISTHPGADIVLKTDLEDRNFTEIEDGCVFASIAPGNNARIDVKNENNEDVSDEFFENTDGELKLRKNTTLSMYTTDERAIRQDCLCYFMERLHFQK